MQLLGVGGGGKDGNALTVFPPSHSIYPWHLSLMPSVQRSYGFTSSSNVEVVLRIL